METLSLKISDDEQAILEQLTNRLGCSKSEAVRRAIRLSADPKTTQPLQEPVLAALKTITAKLNSINHAAYDILSLTKQHNESSAEALRETRSWVQRGMFFGRVIAGKFGLRQEALELMKEQIRIEAEEAKKQGGATP